MSTVLMADDETTEVSQPDGSDVPASPGPASDGASAAERAVSEVDAEAQVADEPAPSVEATDVAPTTAAVEPAPADSSPPADDAVSDHGEDPDAPKMEWYVLKVANNREKTVLAALQRAIKREGLDEYFGELLIPTQKVKETKNGKVRIKEEKLFPGYLVVQMEINDDSWYLVRGTSGIGDFTGKSGVPTPMTEAEVDTLLGRQKEPEPGEEKKPDAVEIRVDFAPEDRVKVREGSLENLEGSVDSIDPHTGKVKVLIEIFGRPTEVELEHWQVEKV